MEKLNRKPLQGIANIVRFNWHYYVAAAIVVAILFWADDKLPVYLRTIAFVIGTLTVLSTFVSLAVSYYIYDYSGLYNLHFLDTLNIDNNAQLVNINAGFDETSALIKQKYPNAHLTVFDFYDPAKHTEVSIERARKAYPAFVGTQTISTQQVPLLHNSTSYIFLILAAHEIRNHQERATFFTQLANALQPNGKIIVVEHQRDIANFLAYNFGFLHFFSHQVWQKIFAQANLLIDLEHKTTPFISTFILKKNGVTP